MAARDFGCFFLLLFLPSAVVHAFRQTAWQGSFPHPRKLHTAAEAIDVVGALISDHGGTGAAFPYAKRALELDPLNINANKFMARWYADSGKFAEALPYLEVAVQNAHPDSVYVLMLKEARATLGEHTEAGDT